jgi:hypothetical protein
MIAIASDGEGRETCDGALGLGMRAQFSRGDQAGSQENSGVGTFCSL